jgi:hypothetical protein
MKPRQRPASVIPLGHAVPVEDRDNDSYRAYLFRHKGKVVLAIGCRRFTLAEAYAHWDGIASVNLMADDHDQRKRRRRALYIIKSVIPRAYNRARKLGWKV